MLEDIGFVAGKPTDREMARIYDRILSIPPVEQHIVHRDGVVIGFTVGSTLEVDRRGSVVYYGVFGKTTGIVINGVATVAAMRGTGRASKAMRDLLSVVRSHVGSATIDVEPVPVGRLSSSMNRTALISWYERLGFVARPRDDANMPPRVWRLVVRS